MLKLEPNTLSNYNEIATLVSEFDDELSDITEAIIFIDGNEEYMSRLSKSASCNCETPYSPNEMCLGCKCMKKYIRIIKEEYKRISEIFSSYAKDGEPF